MKKLWVRVWTMFVACLVGTGAFAAAEIGEEAPNFTLPDIAGEATHTLSDHRGSYVVLEWTNYDCPFVVKHYREGHMQRLQQEMAKQGVVWYLICSSAPGTQGHFDAETWARRTAEWEVAAKAVLLDPEGTVGRAYGATHTPHMFVIDPEGVLIYAGAIDSIRSTNPDDIARAGNYVRMALDRARAGLAVDPARTRAYGCTVKYR